MTTPSIPGVGRDALALVLRQDTLLDKSAAYRAAEDALAYIAAHHECACDREHADEWVEMDEATWVDLPDGTRTRREWVVGVFDGGRLFVHRDDLPDPDAEATNALRDASWNVPRLGGGPRPDPLPGLPEAREFLTALREHGWTVTRKGER